jgi:hypothetical protein
LIAWALFEPAPIVGSVVMVMAGVAVGLVYTGSDPAALIGREASGAAHAAAITNIVVAMDSPPNRIIVCSSTCRNGCRSSLGVARVVASAPGRPYVRSLVEPLYRPAVCCALSDG